VNIKAILLQDSHGNIGSLADPAIDPDGAVARQIIEPLTELTQRNIGSAGN
jgi:hypothetical protein